MEDYDPYEAAADTAHSEWMDDVARDEHEMIFFIPEDFDTREWNGEDE